MFLLNFGFLYFPEDKSTYLPAFIELIIIIALCFFVYKGFRILSKKQEIKAKELEARALAERDERLKNESQQ